MTNIQKSPCQSLIKTPVIIFIRAFISAYDSTALDLATKIQKSKTATFRPKMRIL